MKDIIKYICLCTVVGTLVIGLGCFLFALALSLGSVNPAKGLMLPPSPLSGQQSYTEPETAWVSSSALCVKTLSGLVSYLRDTYELNIVAVPDDFDTFTSGALTFGGERGLIILREASQGYVIIVHAVEFKAGDIWHCISSAFRPLTREDGI